MEKSTVMSNDIAATDNSQKASVFIRPMGRILAREITSHEIASVSGGNQTGCTIFRDPSNADTDKQF